MCIIMQPHVSMSFWIPSTQRCRSRNSSIPVAAHLDHEIHSHYRLYPGNYVALDLLENTEAHASEYTPEDKDRFEKYIAGQLAKIQLPNKDEAFLKEKILAMYANPVRNFLAAK